MTGPQFTKWLLRIMAERTWSQRRVARALFVGEGQVSEWKTRGTRMHTDMALRWLESQPWVPGPGETRGRPKGKKMTRKVWPKSEGEVHGEALV